MTMKINDKLQVMSEPSLFWLTDGRFVWCTTPMFISIFLLYLKGVASAKMWTLSKKKGGRGSSDLKWDPFFGVIPDFFILIIYGGQVSQWATLRQLFVKERKFWEMFVVTTFNWWPAQPSPPSQSSPLARDLQSVSRPEKEILTGITLLVTASTSLENGPLKEIYTYFLSKDTVNYVSFGKSLDSVNIAGPGHFSLPFL